MASKVTLTEYFQAVERHLEKTGKMPPVSFRVRICGECIELRFPTEELANVGKNSLSGFLTDDAGPADAAFFYWYDRCDDYLPKGEGDYSSVWRSQDETGTLMIGTDRDILMGQDWVRKRFYYARPQPSTIDCIVYGHAVAGLFSRWASASGYLMIHAAAVGVNGKGVLVVGRSGSGKSTFSISCLVAGMDFVSDDYVLIPATGDITAMPLYTNIAINPDMYQKLPPSEKVKEPACADWWNGKLHFHLQKQDFCENLDIRAIVMPKVSGNDEPSIVTSPMGAAMTQMIYSSLEQLERCRDVGLVRQMAMRLQKLPIFEMNMSTDLTKNPAFLRSFIEKEL